MTAAEFAGLERVAAPDRPGRYAARVDGEVFTLEATVRDGELVWTWDDMAGVESIWTVSWPCARLPEKK